MPPTQGQFTVLKQVVELIPRNLVAKLATQHGVAEQCRSFSPWSHVVTMVYAQTAHALSLNDICDALHHHAAALTELRRATPPSRNGLSHANRTRNADLAEDLFWQTLAQLQTQAPGFGQGCHYTGFPRRFKRLINVVDSTTIALVANCMEWAKHRRRKAAAKCHMCLDLKTFLPRFALVKAADTHDASEARTLCAPLQAGEIVVFDKAYVDFVHLYELDQRDLFWVTRAKTNMKYEVVAELSPAKGAIKRDQRIRLTTPKTHGQYPTELRLVEAEVEIDGKLEVLVFITNNFTWSPSSIADLYASRWGIEVFFKQIKQTLQLADFLGHNENAVRWQIWTALLTYVLLRFIAWRSGWQGSFARLFTAVRGVLWGRFDLNRLLQACCGTARGRPRTIALPSQAYLPGFAFAACGTAPA